MDEDRELILVHLNQEDNVACLPLSAEAGKQVKLGEEVWTLDAAAGPGFKIAIRSIAKGEKILKFGAPIGSATTDITAGHIVHLHNLKSDYIATYTLEEGSKFDDH